MNLRPALPKELERRCIDTIKMMAIDGIEKANSGHPGACMGAVDMVFTLWSRALRFDPAAPLWPDRDRFVLSGGHASMLLYSLLHCFGYDVPLAELQRFRQLDSRTPGHPEHGLLPGVEVTTGPLGQGFAHAVGLALAGRMLASRLNRPGHAVVGYRVFGLCGDGDLMEGLSTEAASLAGHLKLSNLIFLYDSNRITIEGSTDLAFSEDVPARFRACGWHVVECDGYDQNALASALEAGIAETGRPTLIVGHTEIGHGAPTLHGQAKTHGSPLGPDEVRRTREAANWPLEPTFFVPEEVREALSSIARTGSELRRDWERRIESWTEAFPDLANGWIAARRGEVPADLFDRLLAAAQATAGKATRVVSGAVIQAAHQVVPFLAGGAADLAPSTETLIRDAGHVGQGPDPYLGANLHFGIREHAMGSIVNGMALEGSFRPFGATFLVFSDYMKPALRLAALMQTRSIFVFTHDSFGVGEDGPTHQPIEQLWMLRGIPGMTVFRPADALEMAAAWHFAIAASDGPVVIACTRQAVPVFSRERPTGLDDVLRGATVVREPHNNAPDLVIVATGSEVPLAVSAHEILAVQGILARVVSMCSVERFLKQPREVREGVIPPDARVVSIEAGVTTGWHRIVGRDGLTIGLDRFGASAPIEHLREAFGFTPQAVALRIREWLLSHPAKTARS